MGLALLAALVIAVLVGVASVLIAYFRVQGLTA